MSKFQERFGETCVLHGEGESWLAITGEMTLDEATAQFSIELDRVVGTGEVEADWVRFGLFGDSDTPHWQSGQNSGRGAKPIWTIPDTR